MTAAAALEALAQLQASLGLLSSMPRDAAIAAELRARAHKRCDEVREYLVQELVAS